MIIKTPCIITARLLPGIQVGDGTVSITYEGRTLDGRQTYRAYLDAPELEYSTELHSGAGGGSLQSGLAAVLDFMLAAAEAAQATQRGRWSDNADMFPPAVMDWAADNAGEISLAIFELEKEPSAIMERPE